MSQACVHPGAHDDGLRGAGLTEALSAAEQRVAAEGERLTPPRRRVLEQLLGAGGPVKAYDLMATYEAGGRPAKPPTVYRALDFLSKRGLAHRIESLNAYVACRSADPAHVAAFLICDCCGAVAEAEWDLTAQAEAAARDHGYAVERVSVEARGRCPACRPTMAA